MGSRFGPRAGPGEAWARPGQAWPWSAVGVKWRGGGARWPRKCPNFARRGPRLSPILQYWSTELGKGSVLEYGVRKFHQLRTPYWSTESESGADSVLGSGNRAPYRTGKIPDSVLEYENSKIRNFPNLRLELENRVFGLRE